MINIRRKAVSLILALALVFGGVFTVKTQVADAADADYYSSVTATGGRELLGQLHDLITTTHTYYSSYSDCKSRGKDTDPGKGSNTVMEFYTHIDISNSSWDVSGGWNREHVWPKSDSNGLWGTSGGGSDLHHIRPSEKDINNSRGNKKYGNVGTSGTKEYTSVSNVLGGYSNSSTFEPLDNVKGDAARILMYVYTHYNTYSNVGGTTNGKGGGPFGTLNFTHIISAGNEDAAKKLLLEWNKLDPVDEIERYRNEVVYGIQGNRNPFIDNEDYAEAIWGSGTVTPDPPTPAVKPTALSVTPSTLSLTKGGSGTLTLGVTPANADKSVTWTSSDTSVATVANDKVTAVGEGVATVTATSTADSTVSASAIVVVTAGTPLPEPPTTLEAGTYKIAVDLTAAADVGKILYFNGQIANNYYYGTTENEADAAEVVIEKAEYGYTLKTGNKYLEVVTSNGHYNAVLKDTPSSVWNYNTDLKTLTWSILSEGKEFYLGTRTKDGGQTYTTLSPSDTSYITGSNADKVGVTQFVITLIKISGGQTPPDPDKLSISLTPSAATLRVGDSKKLTVTVTPATANAKVAFLSDNTSVATVSQDGTVTAVSSGRANITVICLSDVSVKAVCEITVAERETPPEPTPPDSLNITPSLTLTVGGREKLTVTATPVTANAEVTFESSDTSVATVDEYGNVTAVAAGSAQICATSKADETKKVYCTVTVVKAEDKAEDFRDAVKAIPESGKLKTRLEAINAALKIYNTLNPEEKTAVSSEWQSLQNAIADYNATVGEYNSRSDEASSSALTGAGSIFGWISAIIKALGL